MEWRHWWWAGVVLAALAAGAAEAAAAAADPAPALELGARSARAAKNKAETCRYSRGAWSECDAKSNVRTRSLVLKKGDPAVCERTKTIQKKCKKPCRYDKAAWSECAAGEMWRVDRLKAGSDSSCEPSRRLTKKCANNKPAKQPKDKGRRNRQ